jgi:hypothetical protein
MCPVGVLVALNVTSRMGIRISGVLPSTYTLREPNWLA